MLLLNDHVLKQRWPGFVSGKLSDVAGLVFFPLMLVAALDIGRRIVHRAPRRMCRRDVFAAVTITAAGFAAVKCSTDAANLYSTALGWIQWPVRALTAWVGGMPPPSATPVTVRADPTDLIALPALALAYREGRNILQTPMGTQRISRGVRGSDHSK